MLYKLIYYTLSHNTEFHSLLYMLWANSESSHSEKDSVQIDVYFALRCAGLLVAQPRKDQVHKSPVFCTTGTVCNLNFTTHEIKSMIKSMSTDIIFTVHVIKDKIALLKAVMFLHTVNR